jgi:hypothetical protein
MSKKRQAVITTVFGHTVDRLDRTFLSFAQNKFLELHAFVIGDRLPEKRIDGITYHLKEPDDRFILRFRDCQHRRFLWPDLLDVEYALIVDGNDVLCLQPFPELPELLGGASVGGVVEYRGGNQVLCGIGCSNFMNDGVTFWHVPSSRELRQQIFDRGLSMYRAIYDDQECFNEVVNTHYDKLTILPCQYNYRAYLHPHGRRGWPTVKNLDGVKIYHNGTCLDAARKLLPVAPMPTLKPLPIDKTPPNRWERLWRRYRHKLWRYE